MTPPPPDCWTERALRPLGPRGPSHGARLRSRCERLGALCRKLGVPPAGTAATDAAADEPADDDELAQRAGALHAALVRHLSHAEAVQAVFTRHRALFETVELAVASFAARADAERCLADVRAGERAFPAALPDDPAPMEALPEAGYVGVAMRGDLPPELAEPAFAAGPQSLAGPVPYAGRHWLLWRCMLPRPLMNEGVYRHCEDLLVEERLRAELPATR